MKKLFTVFLFIAVFHTALQSQSPVVQSIINEINSDSLAYFVKELSGEVPTIIGGSLYTIVSRHKDQQGNNKAADYIKQKLSGYGLAAFDQNFSSTGRNVYGVQTGTEFPNQKYIICAHYDDMPSGTTAPGADDNASGTAAVIEAARIFSNYSFPYTIIYALWDEEEQGLIGSDYYAQQAYLAGDSIMGVINLDMIAWDSNNDNDTDLHTRPISTSLFIKDKMVEVNNLYSLGLAIDIINPGGGGSDHWSFWNYNFGAILLIEDNYDFNAYYHTTDDKIIYFNQSYYHKMSRLAIGTLATLALNLDLKIIHTPIASRKNTNNIETSANIVTGLEIGIGINGPRLYYRINPGSGWSQFFEVVGVPVEDSVTYNFTIPGQQLGTIVQYYLAAQDENSYIVTTLPSGGGGYSPPGSTPPPEFFQFFVAQISIAFSDSVINLNNWTAAGGWDTTAQKFTSSPYSLTDSPGGNYPINANATLTLNNSISLVGSIDAVLEFQTQWDIETDWDYGQLLISTNDGTSWVPLEGIYTNPGTGSFQPNGEPLYDGSQLSWVKETIDLSNYIGQQIKLRFLLRSDGYVVEDGWYVDDINLIVYEYVSQSTEPIASVYDYSLEQNYPNPFNPSTRIQYAISSRQFVSLKVFDVLGNEIETLVNEEKPAGTYEVTWNAANLPSGVYFYQLKAKEFVETKKMLLLK